MALVSAELGLDFTHYKEASSPKCLTNVCCKIAYQGTPFRAKTQDLARVCNGKSALLCRAAAMPSTQMFKGAPAENIACLAAPLLHSSYHAKQLQLKSGELLKIACP
eukprot:1160534-Pelagomonas_calceolata.AAC.13